MAFQILERMKWHLRVSPIIIWGNIEQHTGGCKSLTFCVGMGLQHNLLSPGKKKTWNEMCLTVGFWLWNDCIRKYKHSILYYRYVVFSSYPNAYSMAECDNTLCVCTEQMQMFMHTEKNVGCHVKWSLNYLILQYWSKESPYSSLWGVIGWEMDSLMDLAL